MRRVMMSIAILCALTDPSVAQQPSSTPAFEVASVKPSTTGTQGWSISYSADSLHATNATLSALIQSAYGIRPDRLVGGQNWVRTLGVEVIDQTGLQGRWDFVIAYAPLEPNVSPALASRRRRICRRCSSPSKGS